MVSAVDPFASARRRLARAKQHISDLQGHHDAFFEGIPYKHAVETNAEGLKEHKVKLTAPIPDIITDLAYEAIEALRSVLDHAMHAIATACRVQRPDLVLFPFADRATDLDNVIKGRTKDIHPDIVTYLRGLKPYNGGDQLLHALNSVRRQSIHRLIVPVGIRNSGNVTFRFDEGTQISPVLRIGKSFGRNGPVWDSGKDELVYMVAAPTDHFKYDVVIALSIAFGPEVEGLAGKAVLEFFAHAVVKVERIVGDLETRAKGLGLVA